MAVPADWVPEQQLHESFRKQAVRAQIYRLLSFATASACDRWHLLDMLAPGVPIGLQDVSRLRVAGPNAEISALAVSAAASAATQFQAELHSPSARDGSSSAALSGSFAPGTELLPRLVELNIAEGAPCDREDRAPPTAAPRIRSLVHYFFALVENPARDSEPFSEILSPSFSLHFLEDPIIDLEAVRAWVAGRLSSAVASEHDILSILWRDLGKGRLAADVKMKSQALLADGSGVISRNRQRWTIVDDPGERFARITEILIDRDSLDFFGPGPDYAPKVMPLG